MKYPTVTIIKECKKDKTVVSIYEKDLVEIPAEIDGKPQVGLMDDNNYPVVEVRHDGNLEGFGFFLSAEYDWQIVMDDSHQRVLLPTVKKK